MRADFRPLHFPSSAPADGDSVACADYLYKTVQLLGAFTGSVDIEASLNKGVTWGKVQTGITAPGVYAVAPTCTNLRLRVTALTAGTPTAMFGGFDGRSDV